MIIISIDELDNAIIVVIKFMKTTIVITTDKVIALRINLVIG